MVEEESLLEDIDSTNSIADEYRAALEKIETLSAALMQQRELCQDLEEESRGQKLMIDEMRSSFQHEVAKITEERERDLETFDQLKEFVGLLLN